MSSLKFSKVRIFIFINIFIFLGRNCFSQTHPAAQSIPYTQDFGNNWFKLANLPTGFAIWTASPTQCISNTEAAGSLPTGDDIVFDSATVVKSPGKAYGYSGIAGGGAPINNGELYLQTSAAASGTDQIILAINSTGYSNITVSFDVEMINPQPRLTGFVFQYRVGTTDPFTTLDSSYWNNSTSRVQNQVDYFVNVPLPSPADNQSLIELRWAMSRDVAPAAAGSCGLGFDNFVVSGLNMPPLYFRSYASGNWNAIGTWESSIDNINWNAATRFPNSGDNRITIRSPHKVSTSGMAELVVDELTIDSGATMLNAYGTLLGINDGPYAVDLDVFGTFVDSSNFSVIWPNTSRWRLAPNATLIKTTNTSSTGWQLKYYNGISNIPSNSNWVCRKPAGATVEPSISTTNGGPPNAQVYYGNLFIENNSGSWNSNNLCKFSGSVNYPIIKGNLYIGGNGNNSLTFLNSNTNASPVKVIGDVIIKSGSTLSVTGTGVEVQGNFVSDGIYTHSGSTSKLLFSGTNSQNISGLGSISTYKLEINKSSGSVNDNNNVSVFGNLNLLSGIVVTTLTGKIIVNDDATATNASDNSFVSGPIQKIGDDVFNFPVGKLNNYQPIAINGLAGGGTTRAFTAEYFNQNPGLVYGNNMGPGVDHISQCEYWTLSKDNGGATKDVTLTWDANSCGVTNLSTLIVARFNSSQWINEGNTATSGSASGGTITSTNTPGFGPFTFASTTSENPLPMTLLYFTAKYDGREVLLNWETASEINNLYFTVQRSADGYRFNDICTQAGAGNSTEINSYHEDDWQPLSGVSYYRLKQTDYDGNISYSSIVPLRIKEDNVLNISLLPTKDNSSIQFEATFPYSGKAQVDITDAAGKTILSSPLYAQTNSQVYSLNNSKMSSGIYYFRIYFGDEVFVKKFFY